MGPEMSKKKNCEMDLKMFSKKKKKVISKKKKKLKKKKAVLVGLNPQRNPSFDMKGQLLRMKKQLMELRGFLDSNIVLMIEEDEETEIPTSINLRFHLGSLLNSAKPGDILFIHLIAYGCSQGCILTADKQHLPDSYFRQLISKAGLMRCSLTFVSDCLIEPVADCSCLVKPKPSHPLIFSEKEKDKKIRAILNDPKAFEKRAQVSTLNDPKAFKKIAQIFTVDFRYLTPTKLSSVNILKKDHDRTESESSSSSSRRRRRLPPVILLTPFHCDQNAAAQQDVSEVFFPPPKGTNHLPHGALTDAMLDVIEHTHGRVTNLELARNFMEKLGPVPGLCCNHHHHAHASFVC